MSSRTSIWEIGVSLAFIVGCLVVLWETRDIPPGVFEPLGSAPVPQAIAGLIIVLSLTVIVTAVRRGEGGDEPLGYTPRMVDAFVVAVLTVVYVFFMQARLLSFAPLTTIYLTVVIAFLTRFRLKSLPVALIAGAVTGWGCQYVFTRIFVVDLPGL